MKKAYLVTFEITTRVVADVNDGFDPNNCNLINENDDKDWNSVLNGAMKNISSDPEGYLCNENVLSVMDDTECPYEGE